MGDNIFKDIYQASRWLSQYLPLGEQISLDEIADGFSPKTGGAIHSLVEGKHAVIAARTGQGKTTLVKAWVAAYKQKYPYINVYHLDTKKLGDFTAKDGPIYRSYEPPLPLRGIGQVQIWQPETDDEDMYDRYFGGILRTGKPAVVDIDESANLKMGPNGCPKNFELLLKQGRMPGISVLTNMQEIARSPRQPLSQSTYIVGFDLYNRYDAQIMKQLLRLPPTQAELPLGGLHSFLFTDRDRDGSPTLYRDYRQFIQKFLSW